MSLALTASCAEPAPSKSPAPPAASGAATPSAVPSTSPSPTPIPAPSAEPKATAPPASLREHLLFSAASDDPRPLVVVLHGYGVSAEIVAGILDAEAIAREHDLHVLLPNGTADSSGRRGWNATDACCDFDGRQVDDLRALRELIAEVVSRHAVDRDRIYVAGFSNGAFMAHRLACEMSDVLAAVVSMSGVGFDDPDRCAAEHPVALLQIHGDADRIVSYEGGQVLGRGDLPPHPSTEETAARWAKRNGCAGHREETFAFSGRDTSRRVYLDCQAPVERWRVKGGGHLIGSDATSVERMLAFLLEQRREQ